MATASTSSSSSSCILDGYRLLEAAGVRVPDDVFRVVLSGHALVFTEVERAHLAEFSNLTYLDVGGHNLALSSLAALPSLTELHLPCNGLQTIYVPASTSTASVTTDVINGVATSSVASTIAISSASTSSSGGSLTSGNINDATLMASNNIVTANVQSKPISSVIITNETGTHISSIGHHQQQQQSVATPAHAVTYDDNDIGNGNDGAAVLLSSSSMVPFASLRVLDLSYNVLQARSISQLCRIIHLTDLNLSGNDLPELPSPADMSSFRSLKKLSLRRNRLGQQYRNSTRHNGAVHARAMAMSLTRSNGHISDTATATSNDIDHNISDTIDHNNDNEASQPSLSSTRVNNVDDHGQAGGAAAVAIAASVARWDTTAAAITSSATLAYGTTPLVTSGDTTFAPKESQVGIHAGNTSNTNSARTARAPVINSIHNWDKAALISLASIPRLEELDLSENHFEEIPHDLPNHFPSLRVLNVSYNFFASESSLIPLVDCCPSLKWLDVRGNLFNVPRLHTPNRADDFPHMKYAFNVAGVNVVFAQPKSNVKYDESHIMRARSVSSKKVSRTKPIATTAASTSSVAVSSSLSSKISDQTFLTSSSSSPGSNGSDVLQQAANRSDPTNIMIAASNRNGIIMLPRIDRSIISGGGGSGARGSGNGSGSGSADINMGHTINSSRDEKYAAATSAIAATAATSGNDGDHDSHSIPLQSRLWQVMSSSSGALSPMTPTEHQQTLMSFDELSRHAFFQVSMSGSPSANQDSAIRSVRALKTALNGRLPAVSFAPENVRRYEKGTKARRGRVVAHKEFHVGERKMPHRHSSTINPLLSSSTIAASSSSSSNGMSSSVDHVPSQRSRTQLYNRVERTLDNIGNNITHALSSTTTTTATAMSSNNDNDGNGSVGITNGISSSHTSAISRRAIASSVSAGVAARVAVRRRNERDNDALHDLVTSVSHAFRQSSAPSTPLPILPSMIHTTTTTTSTGAMKL